MDVNKNKLGCSDQVKLSAQEQTIKLGEEKYERGILPDIKLFMAGNLKEDSTSPLACNNTSNFLVGYSQSLQPIKNHF